MSERQLAVVCHCNTLVDCVSKSSLTLFLQTGRHITFLRRQRRERERGRKLCILSLSLFPNAAECSTRIDSNPRWEPFILECVWGPVGDRIHIHTHTCVHVINLAAAGVAHISTTAAAQRRTHWCRQTDTKTYARRQVHTQRAQGLTSKASCWAGLSSLLHWAELTGLQAGGWDPVCLNTVPCQGLCFWGWQLSAAG